MQENADHREFADMAHGGKLVDKAEFDKTKKKTTLTRSRIRSAKATDWVINPASFATLQTTYGKSAPAAGGASATPATTGASPVAAAGGATAAAAPAATGAAPGTNYMPTAAQNTAIGALGISLDWIVPDGFCMFGAVGAVTTLGAGNVHTQVINALANNTHGARAFVATLGVTWEQALDTVRRIRTEWSAANADIVLPLIAHVLGLQFRVIQTNGTHVDVGTGTQHRLVRVTNPNAHYHATR